MGVATLTLGRTLAPLAPKNMRHESADVVKRALRADEVVAPLLGDRLVGVHYIVQWSVLGPLVLRDDLERARVAVVIRDAVIGPALSELLELQRADGVLVVLLVDEGLRGADVPARGARGLGEHAGREAVLRGVRWRGTLSTKNPKAMVDQWSMKMDARAFCSRMPSEMPIDMAIREAEIEYSSHRHQQKASSICLFHQRRSRVSRPQAWRCDAGSSRQGAPPVVEPISLKGAHDARPEVEEGRGGKPRDDERRVVDRHAVVLEKEAVILLRVGEVPAGRPFGEVVLHHVRSRYLRNTKNSNGHVLGVAHRVAAPAPVGQVEGDEDHRRMDDQAEEVEPPNCEKKKARP